MIAISAEVTVGAWDVDRVLSGSRLRTRRSYAATSVADVLDGGFGLLPSFSAPHYSVVIASYTEDQAEQLIDALGAIRRNPHYVRTE